MSSRNSSVCVCGGAVHFLLASQQPCWLNYSVIRLMGLKAACHEGLELMHGCVTLLTGLCEKTALTWQEQWARHPGGRVHLCFLAVSHLPANWTNSAMPARIPVGIVLSSTESLSFDAGYWIVQYWRRMSKWTGISLSLGGKTIMYELFLESLEMVWKPQKGRVCVSGKLQIYSVIKTSKVRQLTGSIKAEPKLSRCRESVLISEWSYENKMKEHIKLQYILHVSACSGSQDLSSREKGYMWVEICADSVKCKFFESEAVGSLLSRGWVHGHSRPRSVFVSVMTLLMTWVAGKAAQPNYTCRHVSLYLTRFALSVLRLFVTCLFIIFLA